MVTSEAKKIHFLAELVFYRIDIRDKEGLAKVFTNHNIIAKAKDRIMRKVGT